MVLPPTFWQREFYAICMSLIFVFENSVPSSNFNQAFFGQYSKCILHLVSEKHTTEQYYLKMGGYLNIPKH